MLAALNNVQHFHVAQGKRKGGHSKQWWGRSVYQEEITQLTYNREKWREFVDAPCSPRAMRLREYFHVVLLYQVVLQTDLYDQERSLKLYYRDQLTNLFL